LAGLALAVLVLAYAWHDGGIELVHQITSDVAIPGETQ
jgi:hypothetical protein